MKKTLLLFNLLLCLNSFCQVGLHNWDIITYMKIDTNLYDIKVSEIKDDGEYYMSAFHKSENIITIGYYFNKSECEEKESVKS